MDTVWPVDPLSALLDADDRAVEVVVTAPWSLTLGERDEALILAVSAGEAWVHRDEGEPLHLRTHDVALLRADGARMLAHSARPPRPLPRGDRPFQVEGTDPAGDTHLFLRRLTTTDQAAANFLATLGPDQVFTSARDSRVWDVLHEEAQHLSFARAGVLARLVDLVFVDAVRRWVADGDSRGWARAVLDPVVGAALHLFHAEPAHPWTLEEVAARVGTSRTSLSRRFQMLVGEPPMTYLREWRLTQAASLLCQGESVTATARRSGFADPFVFSSAFSKKFGLAPGRYRDRGAADTA